MDELANAVQHLRTGDIRQRAAVARLLGERGDPAAVPPLLSALRDSQERVRRAALDALCELGGEEVATALAQALLAVDSERMWTRTLCAEGLARLKAAETLPQLLKALDDPYPHVRAAAARAVGQLGDASVVPRLSRLLGDLLWVRVQAVHALADAGGEAAVPALQPLLTDPDFQLRYAAAAALGQVGDARSAPALMEAAGRGQGDVALAAVLSLRSIAERDPDPALRALIPGLRELALARSAGWDRFPGVCRELIRLIETRTEGIHALPRPSSAVTDPAALPLPAESPRPSGETLPRPAAEPEETHRPGTGG
ncbi:MAG: HEAT repeat domain-containing protein [Armatimonadota bacterium]